MQTGISQIYDVNFIIFVTIIEIEHFFGALNRTRNELNAYLRAPSKLRTANTD